MNIQRTQPALLKNDSSTAVKNATIELRAFKTDELVTIFEKRDEFNYVTPSTFLPEKNNFVILKKFLYGKKIIWIFSREFRWKMSYITPLLSFLPTKKIR